MTTWDALAFEYEEDRAFFERLFGPDDDLDRRAPMFDFRDPSVKRREFRSVQPRVLRQFLASGASCMLRIDGVCDPEAPWSIDHVIPLSSNTFNRARGVPAPPGKKVPRQSFGSNHVSNLVLACMRCNQRKWKELPEPEEVQRLVLMLDRIRGT